MRMKDLIEYLESLQIENFLQAFLDRLRDISHALDKLES